jgi:hypothetical protein
MNSLLVGNVPFSLWEPQKVLSRKILPTKIAEAVTLTTLPFIQAINEYRSTKATFFHDKVLLVGDALATCRPHSQSSGEQVAVVASTTGNLSGCFKASMLLVWSNSVAYYCRLLGHVGIWVEKCKVLGIPFTIKIVREYKVVSN